MNRGATLQTLRWHFQNVICDRRIVPSELIKNVVERYLRTIATSFAAGHHALRLAKRRNVNQNDVLLFGTRIEKVHRAPLSTGQCSYPIGASNLKRPASRFLPLVRGRAATARPSRDGRCLNACLAICKGKRRLDTTGHHRSPSRSCAVQS